MQYLIRHITDSTNHTFTEVIKPRENERYEIVSAESKEEAEEKYKAMVRAKVLRQVVKDFKNFKNNILNSKAQLHYINSLYYLYVYLRIRDTVTNVWYGIRSVLEKIPDEHRYKLLKDVK